MSAPADEAKAQRPDWMKNLKKNKGASDEKKAGGARPALAKKKKVKGAGADSSGKPAWMSQIKRKSVVSKMNKVKAPTREGLR